MISKEQREAIRLKCEIAKNSCVDGKFIVYPDASIDIPMLLDALDEEEYASEQWRFRAENLEAGQNYQKRRATELEAEHDSYKVRCEAYEQALIMAGVDMDEIEPFTKQEEDK